MNCFSFSIFGERTPYFLSFLPSIIRAILHLYGKGWKIQIYHDDFLEKEYYFSALQKLQLHNIVCLTKVNSYPLSKSMLVRMRSIWDGYDICVFRDLDYLPLARERHMLQEFFDSKAYFHSCSDHECHNIPLMGGMIACKTEQFINVTGFNSWDVFISKENDSFFEQYGKDQDYLCKHIWPIIEPYTFEHRLKCQKFNKCMISKNLITKLEVLDNKEFYGDKDTTIGGYSIIKMESIKYYESLLDNYYLHILRNCGA